MAGCYWKKKTPLVHPCFTMQGTSKICKLWIFTLKWIAILAIWLLSFFTVINNHCKIDFSHFHLRGQKFILITHCSPDPCRGILQVTTAWVTAIYRCGWEHSLQFNILWCTLQRNSIKLLQIWGTVTGLIGGSVNGHPNTWKPKKSISLFLAKLYIHVGLLASPTSRIIILYRERID